MLLSYLLRSVEEFLFLKPRLRVLRDCWCGRNCDWLKCVTYGDIISFQDQSEIGPLSLSFKQFFCDDLKIIPNFVFFCNILITKFIMAHVISEECHLLLTSSEICCIFTTLFAASYVYFPCILKILLFSRTFPCLILVCVSCNSFFVVDRVFSRSSFSRSHAFLLCSFSNFNCNNKQWLYVEAFVRSCFFLF